MLILRAGVWRRPEDTALPDSELFAAPLCELYWSRDVQVNVHPSSLCGPCGVARAEADTDGDFRARSLGPFTNTFFVRKCFDTRSDVRGRLPAPAPPCWQSHTH